jgi:hypothetical protein
VSGHHKWRDIKHKGGLPPLRTVVERRQVPIGDTGYTRTVEVLSCGHEQPVKQDAYGHYYAERRRCKKCQNGPTDGPTSDDPIGGVK